MGDNPSRGEVTRLLAECREGRRGALDLLMPLVHGELRRLAGRHMRGERSDHTLQPTALVHEAYARLVGTDITWRDRAQFFQAASTAMRHILVDHARARRTAKRGGGAKVSLDGHEGPTPAADLAGFAAASLPPDPADLLDLDRALTALESQDARKARVVELHFFGGLGFDEIARALDVSKATVDRDMRLARAWLLDSMRGGSRGR